MKKLFAFALCMVLMLSNLVIRAEAVTTDTQAKLDTTETLNVEEKDDGLYTLEILNGIHSWEQITDYILPIDVHYTGNETEEDLYIMVLVRDLDRLVGVEEFSMSFKDIDLTQVDYGRLIQKFWAVTDIYNVSNKKHLVLEPKFLENDVMQINIQSVEAEDENYITMKIGQKVVLKAGTRYWESTLRKGSGRYGTAEHKNNVIPKDLIVTVNGFAYLGINGKNIDGSLYIPYTELGKHEYELKPWQDRMVHVCTGNVDLGWVHLRDVVGLN